ncbi:hypothetical protein QYG89_01775 [Bacillus sp. B190/17]|uniref:Uncharacterized protein n=1 Tax=Bacillus lumedeiriae TaxID=3058829 RepID=A0ABW8I4R5_9BACI
MLRQANVLLPRKSLFDFIGKRLFDPRSKALQLDIRKAEPTVLGRQAYDRLTKWRFSAMQSDWHMTSSHKEAEPDTEKWKLLTS